MILASAVLCVVILNFMRKVGQFTNFVAVHSIMVVSVVVVNFLSAVVGFISGECFSNTVNPPQLNQVIYAALGLLAFLARIVDKDFRLAVLRTFSKNPSSFKPAALELSEEMALVSEKLRKAAIVTPKTYTTVFQNLHLKLIMDSLIALSFNLACAFQRRPLYCL